MKTFKPCLSFLAVGLATALATAVIAALTGCSGAHPVSNQIAVAQRDAGHSAGKVKPDLDKEIERKLDAALIQGGLHNDINYEVKGQVITMTGELDSQLQRTQAQDIAAAIPNVRQVVNELRVKKPTPLEEPLVAR
jgi:osmotically-inducible protein OsmY